jgi:hypothetical protein
VSIHLHFRIHGHVQSLVRRVRRFLFTTFVLLVLFASVVVGKNIFLGQLKREVGKTLAYGRMRISYLPPAVILEDVGTLAGETFFRARRVRVEVPFLSLVRNEKSVNVVIEGPEVRLRAGTPKPGRERPKAPLALPFAVGRGLVLDGTFVYESERGSFEARGLRALFTQRVDEFALKTTAEAAIYTILPEKLSFGGALNVALTGKGSEVKLERLTVEGPDFVVKGEGQVKNLRDPEIDLDTRFEVETAFAAAFLDLPFEWKGKAGGQGKFVRKGGQSSFRSDLRSDRLVLSGVNVGRVSGRLGIDFGKGGRVDLGIQKADRPAETVAITFGGGKVEGEVRGAFLDPLMSEIRLPWPVRSPAWGSFTLENDRLRAQAEFRDEDLRREGDRFALRGAVDVRVNLKTKDVEVTTPDLLTGFARVEARSALRVGGGIDTEIRGTVSDLKQAREFVSLLLAEKFDFPEIRGSGYVNVRLTGLADEPKVALRGSFEPGGFDLFNVAFVEGDATIAGGLFEGQFRVDDPDLKGNIRVTAGPEKTEAEVRNAEGDIARVLAGLQIPVALEGRAAGDFRIIEASASEDVSGTFSSPEVRGYGQTFRNVAGRLEWKSGTLSFPEIGFDLYGGRAGGRVLVGLDSRAFDADLRAESIDLARLTASRASGLLSLQATGRGVFGKDKLTGTFAVRDLVLPPIGKAEARGDFGLDYAGDRIDLDVRADFLPGANHVEARFGLPLDQDALSGNLEGHWTNLDLLLPWTGAKGRLDFSVDARGPRSAPRVSATVIAGGPLLPLPRFPQAVTDYSGTVRFEDGRVSLADFKGKLGGGDVKGSGWIGLGPSGAETIDVSMDGKDMLLSPLERTRALVDANLRLIKDSRQFVLDGDILVKRLTWRREIYEKLSFLSAPNAAAGSEPGFFDNLALNLRLRATDNALMDNSLGRVSGRFDLTLTGDVSDPVLLGDIEARRGTVNFQDQEFRIVKGRVSFFDPAGLEPYVEARGETYIKNYRVTIDLSGPAGRLKPEFSSSPPLSPSDVLALLALGEGFQNTYSYDPERSSTLSTASLLSYQVADEAKKRAQGLFTLDRFRIDPFVNGTSAEMTARLTVGKKLSRNLLVVYSTNLGTQREEIFRLEWDVSADFSLIGLRNDLGKISFDLRYRTRF